MIIPNRQTTSALGMYLQPMVAKFLKDNARFPDSARPTPEDGCELLAHAISYAIAKAFESPLVISSFGLANAAMFVPAPPTVALPAMIPPGPGPLIINSINLVPETT
jgi:hypothetical protein